MTRRAEPLNMPTRRAVSLAFAATLVPLPVFAQAGADARFAAWLRGVQAEAVKAGVDPGTAQQALGSVQLLPEVMELARNQPEFKMSWAEYQNLVVSAERVKNGKALLAQNRALIDRFALPVGMPSSMVVALWGIESNYGARQGDFEVVPALATLAFNNFRATFFRQQLIASLKIVSQGHIGLHQLKGSWAGAMGQCQFIPTSFLAYAKDGDGDGRADIWTNKADVFASITNYIHAAGWRPGESWGREIAPGSPAVAGERIVRPAGANGPAYATTANFRAILRWNQSDFFALAVGLLSDRIAS
jgi:membrane-bound lytic murein transglycosylase B